MNTKEVMEKLKTEAQANPASNAVFTVFALRERARNTVMLNSLHHKMKKSGFKYSKADYLPVLRLLANLGLGQLDIDSKGRIRGIKNIRITLQSIGAVACGQKDTLSAFNVRNKFMKLIPKAPSSVQEPKEVPNTTKFDLNLELSINGKVVHIPVPKELSRDDIAVLISKFRSA